MINQPETQAAESVLARRWALLAQNDARLTELADCWERLSENEKDALLTLARGMVK